MNLLVFEAWQVYRLDFMNGIFHYLVSIYLLNGHTDKQEKVDQIPDLIEQNLRFSR